MLTKAQDDEAIMALVDAALTKPVGERKAYVQEACASDPELRDKVWSYVEWEARMNGFMLEPLFSIRAMEHPFEPGELLDQRFRIVREVAQGGMGIVYEAWDEKLERRIALKCAKPGFDNRLPPEVRHATQIAHTNVCKIFEIHTTPTRFGEIDFLTMEFLEGETLAQGLARGALPEAEALTITRQLCAGLAEAHSNQVIHGDLKSNNVILTTGANGALRAVITDFGLAKGAEAQLAAARSGVSAGTPDYMAPELWTEAKASVASDIYALGVILHELISGRRPYEASPSCVETDTLSNRQPDSPSRHPHQTTLSWEDRLTRKPPPVHPHWDRILLRCLDPDPARRFRNVDELAAALAPKSRRWMLGAAAAIVLAAISAVVMRESALPTPETMRLAVLPFEVSAADRPLGDGLLHQTAQQLQRVKNSRNRHLTVIPLDAAVQSKLDRPDKAIRSLGATHVLHGTLAREGNRVLIHAYLIDARSQIPMKEWQAGLQPNELGEAPVALAGMITGALGLLPLAVAVSVNVEAFPDFTRGIGLMERNATDEAIPLLENAVRADPDSPLTHARLAEAQMLKYSSTSDVAWLEQAILSLDDARRRSPDLAEVLLVSGIVDQYRGLYETAEAELRRVLEIEPENGDVWRRLGQVYQSNNRFADAIPAYHKAIEVQPGYFKNYQALCDVLSNEENYEEAVSQCATMIGLAPGLSESYFARARAYFDWEHYLEAENDLRTALELDQTSSKAVHLLADVLFYEGRYQEAISLFKRALEIGPGTYLLYLDLGQTFRRANLSEQAREAYWKAATLAKAELATNSRDMVIRARLAYLWARLGEKRQSESEAVLALQPGPDSADVSRWVVMAYEAVGERERALAVAERSPDATLRRLNRSPDMADLCNNPRFQQLMRSRNIP